MITTGVRIIDDFDWDGIGNEIFGYELDSDWVQLIAEKPGGLQCIADTLNLLSNVVAMYTKREVPEKVRIGFLELFANLH